uniref:Ubiquitinyl hydrolase 1 n=1 Tax=Ditylenchus dipsaci TaxID=166011 RepID=A0A915DG86_9BILA
MKRHLILSEKGKEMLDFPEGFLHWRKNSRGKRIYWRCIYYEAGKNGERSCKCPGRAVTVDGQPKITSAHNHLSDKNQSELKRFQCKVQQEAMLTKDKPRAIISTLLTSVKAEASQRNIANVEPANPKSLRELQISASFATINNENCLNTTDGMEKNVFSLSVLTDVSICLWPFQNGMRCNLRSGAVAIWTVVDYLCSPCTYLRSNGICVDESDHSEQSEYAEELCLFLDYFEDTYVGRIKKRTERKKPRYAIEKWSVHQLVKKNEPRTNNGIESFNGQLLRTMACSHPTVWKLLTAVLDELVLADQRVSSYWSGGSTPRRNNAYLQLSERLRKTVQRYSTQPKIEYLKSIAHNLGGFLVEKKIEKLQPEIWRRKSHGIPAKGSSDVAKYGSTLHIIAATKLFDVNILTFNEDIGWTLYTPDVETGPSPELLQDAEKPTFALSYNGSHFDVILEI